MKGKLFLLGLLIISSTALFSDDDDHEREEHRSKRADLSNVTNAKWKTECSSCHMLYLPGLLPARSWEKMMTGLDKHFGESAELDPVIKKEITDFLVKNSSDNASNRRGQKILKTISKNDAPLRISETSYFIRKHDEVNASVYKRKAIGSAANCIACHSGAEQGNFSEHQVKIPSENAKPAAKK